jgi:hypothetical protein
MMKKYQGGGGVRSSRAVMNALRGIQSQQKTGRGMGDIWTQRVMGETQEKLQREFEEWQAKIRREQSKGKGMFKKLKFLDFIPGGKWVKAALQAGVAYKGAKDLKDTYGEAGGAFGGWKNTFMQKQAKDLSETFKEAGKDIDPTSALVKSLVTSAVSSKAGETFKDAFKGPVTDSAATSGSKFTGDPFTTKINVAGDAGGVGFRPKMDAMDIAGDVGGVGFRPDIDISKLGSQAATPWKDQFLGQFGLGEDMKFGDLFKPGQSEGAVDFLSKWGLIPGEGTGMDAPFFHAGQEEGPEGQYQDMYSKYVGSQIGGSSAESDMAQLQRIFSGMGG